MKSDTTRMGDVSSGPNQSLSLMRFLALGCLERVDVIVIRNI